MNRDALADGALAPAQFDFINDCAAAIVPRKG